MLHLPPSTTPLNQHSLKDLETWLRGIGAERSSHDPTIWDWLMPGWSAQIKLDIETLRITWEKNGIKQQCSFPYGLSRDDVETSFFQGP